MFYDTMIKVNMMQSEHIGKHTRMQSENSKWFQEREFHLIASVFGTFLCTKDTTDTVKTFKNKKMFFTSKSVKHGIQYENTALAKYMENQSVEDYPVSFIVNPKIPFLVVSPDKLVMCKDELKLVEIKCPFSLFEKKMPFPKQTEIPHFYMRKENGDLRLSTKHDY